MSDHEYDGIREYDNPLPGWWKLTFGATFVFALGYLVHYHLGGPGESVAEEYAADMRLQDERRAQEALASGALDEQTLEQLMKNAALVDEGKQKFTTVCAVCHLPTGAGSIGPNLTDEFWLHGRGQMLDIYKVVSEGVLDKGMPAWSKTLRPDEVKKVVAFVGTLRHTNVAGGKAPQGSREN